jgi:hypothetical protein
VAALAPALAIDGRRAVFVVDVSFDAGWSDAAMDWPCLVLLLVGQGRAQKGKRKMIITGKTRGGLQQLLARLECWLLGHKPWVDAPILVETMLSAALLGKYRVPCTRCGENVEVLVG